MLQSRSMKMQSNGKSRHWRAWGLESIGVKGHENRCFRGRRSGGEVVRGHRSWELHGSDVGGVGGMGLIWGDSEGPEIGVQSPARGCGGGGLVSVPLGYCPDNCV